VQKYLFVIDFDKPVSFALIIPNKFAFFDINFGHCKNS